MTYLSSLPHYKSPLLEGNIWLEAAASPLDISQQEAETGRYYGTTFPEFVRFVSVAQQALFGLSSLAASEQGTEDLGKLRFAKLEWQQLVEQTTLSTASSVFTYIMPEIALPEEPRLKPTSSSAIIDFPTVWGEKQLPESPFLEYQPSEVDKFLSFFTKQVSKIVEVVEVSARMDNESADIYTIFDSDDEEVRDSIYQLEQDTFAHFPRIKADFHTLNLRDFEESSWPYLFDTNAKVVFSRKL